MINAIYGKKIGMTQIFDDQDRIVPVTVIQAEPNTVCQVKTVDTDGYEAVQMGFGYIKPRRVNKPMQGHFDAQGAEPKRYLREASPAARAATARTSIAPPVPWASAPRRPACSRACVSRVTWAATPSL